jgi:hypothetical protein
MRRKLTHLTQTGDSGRDVLDKKVTLSGHKMVHRLLVLVHRSPVANISRFSSNCSFNFVSDPYQDWIRIQLGLGVRIQKGKNGQISNKKEEILLGGILI